MTDRAAYLKRWHEAHPGKHTVYSRRRWKNKNRIRNAAVRKASRLRKAEAAGRPYPANGLCEICGQPPKFKRLHWDHNHTTGVFRGWLCASCNTMLGLVSDSLKVLSAAIRYLENAAFLD